MKYIATLGMIFILLSLLSFTVYANDDHTEFDLHEKIDNNNGHIGVFTEATKAKHGKSEHGKHDDDSDNDDHFIADNNNGDTDHLPN
nr:hypothetical protein [Nitrosomonas sp.]